MKLAYSSNAYRRWSLLEAIERVARCGYEAVEIMADEPHVWPATVTDREIDDIRRALDTHGLSISNVNAFMMCRVEDFWHPSWIEPDPAYRRVRVQHTIDALRVARRLGAPCITTEPGGPLPDGVERNQALEWFVAGLTEALRCAQEEGVSLLVEPEPGLLIENVAEFIELAERIDSPMFGHNFDIGHFYCVSEPLEAAVRSLAAHTRHYHIEDIAATRVHEHLIPGEGAIDFAEVLGAVRESGYDGWITVELYPQLDDPDGAGVEARRHLSQWM